MQNRITGTFGTTQVGGMLNFRKVNDEYGISLIGEARIPKREQIICERVIELYERGELNFSFEIRYTEDHIVKMNGITFIDAAEHNALTGMAIVSVPAYDESFALSLVAEERKEVDNSDEEVNKGVEKMDKAENTMTEPVATEEFVAVSEETKPESTTEHVIAETAESDIVAEDAVAEKAKPECMDDDPDDDEECFNDAECKKKSSDAQCKKNSDAECKKKNSGAECKKNTDDGMKDAQCNKNTAKSQRTVSELEIALAKTEADWAVEHAQYMALEAEIADLRANKAAMDAEIERLRAVEAELSAINAAKEAEELAAKQDKARMFAEKQGLNTQDDAVASAVKSLDYQAIAELAMAQYPAAEKPVVSVAGFATAEPMKIKSRFENVLKRVSE